MLHHPSSHQPPKGACGPAGSAGSTGSPCRPWWQRGCHLWRWHKRSVINHHSCCPKMFRRYQIILIEASINICFIVEVEHPFKIHRSFAGLSLFGEPGNHPKSPCHAQSFVHGYFHECHHAVAIHRLDSLPTSSYPLQKGGKVREKGRKAGQQKHKVRKRRHKVNEKRR